MKPTPALLAAAALLLAPTAALAAPFVAVDASAQYVAMIDQASIKRSGTTATADVLAFVTGRSAILSTIRFDCAAGTWQQLSNRDIGADNSLGAPMPANIAAEPARPGTFADSMLQKVCHDRYTKEGSGWSSPTLAQALKDAAAETKRFGAP